MKNGRLGFGLFMVGLGVVFLLNTSGVLGWWSWSYIGRLWPLILVFLGLELLTRRQVFSWGLLVWLALGITWYLAAG